MQNFSAITLIKSGWELNISIFTFNSVKKMFMDWAADWVASFPWLMVHLLMESILYFVDVDYIWIQMIWYRGLPVFWLMPCLKSLLQFDNGCLFVIPRSLRADVLTWRAGWKAVPCGGIIFAQTCNLNCFGYDAKVVESFLNSDDELYSCSWDFSMYVNRQWWI